MKNEAWRDLLIAVMSRAIDDWWCDEKVYLGWCEKYGGKSEELETFFCSGYCDDILQVLEIEFTGAEIWQLLRKGKLRKVNAKDEDDRPS